MEGLRIDGRRWNELRRIHCQLSTGSTTCDGSSYLEQGFTKVLCNVTGPAEPTSRQRTKQDGCSVTAEVYFAAFSGTDRIKRGRMDKYVVSYHLSIVIHTHPSRDALNYQDFLEGSVTNAIHQTYRKVQELQHSIQNTFSTAILTHLFPKSEITISLHILSQDGGVLAACLNATTLALIDAGIPMTDYVVACTSGQSNSLYDQQAGGEGGYGDPWLDVNYLEESDVPFLTVATLGEGEKVVLLVMESKVRIERLEGMIAVGVSGCGRVRGIMDEAVRRHAKEKLEKAGGGRGGE